MKKQVEKEHYEFLSYLDKARWNSYYHQIEEVLKSDSKSALIIGKGDGIVPNILREQIKRNTKLEGKFSKDQLIDIMNGRSKISGLTWHHNEEKGVMQLVEDVIHSQTGHTGGFSIWQRL